MKQKFQKFISGLLTLSTALTLCGLGLTTAYAAPISVASVNLSDNTGSAPNVSYQFTFTASGSAIKAMRFQFRTQPSAVTTVPSMTTTAATLTSAIDTANSNAATGLTTLTNTTNGELLITNTSAYAPSGAATYQVTFAAITNNDSTSNTCDTVADSETCYVRIITYSDTAATAVIDSGVVSYTTISPINVTATVDPSLTFTITGVANTAAIQTNDSNAGCAASLDVATTATAIPFGSIRVATYKCAQQQLNVATNATNGYTVYEKMGATTPSTNVLSGTLQTTNVIDPFTSAYATPGTWSTPTSTTANTNTGYIGIRTTNAGVSGSIPTFGLNQYGAPYVGTGLGNSKVMDKASADLGTTATFVTYKFEVDAAQPSDTYGGKVYYQDVPKY